MPCVYLLKGTNTMMGTRSPRYFYRFMLQFVWALLTVQLFLRGKLNMPILTLATRAAPPRDEVYTRLKTRARFQERLRLCRQEKERRRERDWERESFTDNACDRKNVPGLPQFAGEKGRHAQFCISVSHFARTVRECRP